MKNYFNNSGSELLIKGAGWRSAFWMAMIAVLMGMQAVETARGAVFYVTNSTTGVIGAYDSTTGSVITADLITGLNSPYGIASDARGNLYIGSIADTGTIGKYASDGSVINASLITGVKSIGLAVDGAETLFAPTYNSPRVGAYSATTGATIDENLITGLRSGSYGIAHDGLGHLYVATGAVIGEYNTDGSVVNPNLIALENPSYSIAFSGGKVYVTTFSSNNVFAFDATTGAVASDFETITMPAPTGIAICDGYLFIASNSTGRVAKYNMDGSLVNASLISGLSSPVGIVVVPEPSAGRIGSGRGGAKAPSSAD